MAIIKTEHTDHRLSMTREDLERLLRSHLAQYLPPNATFGPSDGVEFRWTVTVPRVELKEED